MPDLDSLSILCIWTAISIYALAFIAYAFDLARRSEATADARLEKELALHAIAGSGAAAANGYVSGETEAEPAAKPRYVMARIGTVLTGLAFLFQLAATIMRGIAAERVPWANLYEFAMTGTLLVVFVYLLVNTRVDVRFLGTFITGLVIVYVIVSPLADALKSYWLVIHVFVASLGTAFFALACGLSVLQLLQTRRQRRIVEGAEKPGLAFMRTVPNADRLEGMAFRFAIVGFIFWTFTLIAGAIWAQDAWGRYWGFDVKETWTFIIWVLYAGYIHARATRGWRGTPSAWLSIVGFTAVIFNFTVVNVFFNGLHAYSGLS